LDHLGAGRWSRDLLAGVGVGLLAPNLTADRCRDRQAGTLSAIGIVLRWGRLGERSADKFLVDLAHMRDHRFGVRDQVVEKRSCGGTLGITDEHLSRPVTQLQVLWHWLEDAAHLGRGASTRSKTTSGGSQRIVPHLGRGVESAFYDFGVFED
jgi:hypothetical protein